MKYSIYNSANELVGVFEKGEIDAPTILKAIEYIENTPGVVGTNLASGLKVRAEGYGVEDTDD